MKLTFKIQVCIQKYIFLLENNGTGDKVANYFGQLAAANHVKKLVERYLTLAPVFIGGPGTYHVVFEKRLRKNSNVIFNVSYSKHIFRDSYSTPSGIFHCIPRNTGQRNDKWFTKCRRITAGKYEDTFFRRNVT